MLGTFNPLRLVADKNRNAIQVWSAPHGRGIVFRIVSRALFQTDWTTALNTLERPGVNKNAFLLMYLAIAMNRNRPFFYASDMHTVLLRLRTDFCILRGEAIGVSSYRYLSR